MKQWPIITLIIITGLLAWWFFNSLMSPEMTTTSKGRIVAEKYGCFACHSADGIKGFPNPGSKYSTVPSWQGGTAMMFIHGPDDIRQWVMNGRLDGTSGDTAAIVPMPAYGSVMSDQEFKDLELYLRAIMEIIEVDDTTAQKGYDLAKKMGCFSCHGPYGLGGTTNYGGLKGYIPGWEGDDYADLVRNEEELIYWIKYGELERIKDNPFARYFTRNQMNEMPAYDKLLDDEQVNLIIHYINWLRGQSLN